MERWEQALKEKRQAEEAVKSLEGILSNASFRP